MASEEYKRLYPGTEPGRRYEWPDYAPVKESPEVIGQVRNACFAALSMCDRAARPCFWISWTSMTCGATPCSLSTTDHGYMLSEHGFWAKNYMPCYDEIAHTPLYVWDPRFPQAAGQSRNSLVQTIGSARGASDFFGLSRPADMQGRPLSPVLADDTPIRFLRAVPGSSARISAARMGAMFTCAPRDLTDSAA
ncbi:MAG: sulfatase/phosphatase domain-containing protein [Oscillospiraceae bacterium]